MTSPRRLSHRIVAGVSALGAAAIVLAACGPDPAPPPPPPPPPPSCAPTPDTLPPPGVSQTNGVAITVRHPDGSQHVVEAADDGDAEAKAKALRARGDQVLAVAPIVPVWVASADGPGNDPSFNSTSTPVPYGLWGLKRIDAAAAWGSTPLHEGQGAVVAVVDTGVQGDHPGLAGRVLTGWDFTVNTVNPPYGSAGGWSDQNGHGTHVAGTIGEADDAIGGIGVAPQVTILPVRVLGASGGGSSLAVARGINWAADHGADVINLSLGTGVDDPTLKTAIEYALSKNVVVAAAGGNGGSCCSTPTDPSTQVQGTREQATDSPTPVSPSTVSATPSTTMSSTTSATTEPSDAQDPTSTTFAAPAGSIAQSATTTSPVAVTTTTTTTTRAPGTTPTTTAQNEAPAAGTSEAGDDRQAVIIEAGCTSSFSTPLYPAAYADPAHPGLIAVAATGNNLPAAMPTISAGVIHWTKGVGSYVEPGDELAKVGAQSITSPVHGVLTQQSAGEGTSVGSGTVFAQILSADTRATYSNVNDYITVAAPGGGLPSANFGIWSMIPTSIAASGYGYKSGTSMATPHVAGVAALVRSKCDSLTPTQVMNAITSTVQDLGPAGRDAGFGFGMVQADGAVAAVTAC